MFKALAYFLYILSKKLPLGGKNPCRQAGAVLVLILRGTVPQALCLPMADTKLWFLHADYCRGLFHKAEFCVGRGHFSLIQFFDKHLAIHKFLIYIPVESDAPGGSF